MGRKKARDMSDEDVAKMGGGGCYVPKMIHPSSPQKVMVIGLWELPNDPRDINV